MRLLTVLIVVVSVLALTATIATIVVGTRSFEGTVVDKPYEAGIAWDEVRKNRERLGWSVALQETTYKTGKNDLIVMLRDKNGSLLSDAVVAVALSRPSTRAFDKTYPANKLHDGRYVAAIDLPLYGNWDVTIDVSRKNERTSFDKIISAKQDDK
jgi:nitrogen fixation protein FixH